ncbi:MULTISPECIES: hypothetical protein [Simplicispira]|jgi:hypothetical protein|uniref:Flagellar biosynthesis protein FlhG n=1 Tax=Simplicispira metamorpha TaxID=80881 RepID=A0A4R2N3E2_9BURK|nr:MULTISPECIES: hypothetical protein [Simplicispira]MDD2692695.1 hypothetical protein [Simplicispira sp.]TCP14443.1 hypothetical protein EV674_13029 [Simplicispira metamorpha]
MLENSFHQGTGLHCNRPQDELRLLVVASREDARQTQETLWQVCAHLQRLGYPVVVLDATAVETDRTPGLLQLLTHSPWDNGGQPHANANTSTLTVVPAALGLLTLVNTAQRKGLPLQTLEPLEPIFRRYAVVVLHAPLELLTSPLLAGSPAMPLLITHPGKTELVECYRQLKHLAIHAGLTGMVAYMAPSDDAAAQDQARENIQALERCAAHHLGQRLRATLLHEDRAQDMQRLALLLLENAGTITAPAPVSWPLNPLASSAIYAPFVQSH